MDDVTRVALAVRRVAERLDTYDADERERWLADILYRLADEVEHGTSP